MPSSINFKDISLLTQKVAVAGTEKLPVSDTEYITPNQIAGIVSVPSLSTSVTTDAADDTKTSTPHSVKTYVDGIVGNIETLLAAL